MHASIGQYSIQAGEPEQPVQQSVVIASMRGRFLRVAFPSPCDIGQCLSTMSYIRIEPRVYRVGSRFDSNIALRNSSTICVGGVLCLLRNVTSFKKVIDTNSGGIDMQAVTGLFKSHEQAENAIEQVRSLGIPENRIGIVRPGNAPERLEAGVPVSDTEEPGMGRAMGAAVGGAMGAAGGATAGLAVASLAVPGIGPLLAFGMVGAALLGVVGAAAGSAVGNEVEEELGEGIPHEDVYLYEDTLRHGHTVLIAYAEEGEQADRAAKTLDNAGAEDLDRMREDWWREVRDEERAHYQGNFDADEESYRRGYHAALHPQRRGKAYSDVEDELRTSYAGTVLDRPFQSGYERGQAYRSRGVENR